MYIIKLINDLKDVIYELWGKKMTDTIRCFKCSLFCGDSYDTAFFQLDAEVYCSLNCYKEQRLKEETEEIKPKKKSKK